MANNTPGPYDYFDPNTPVEDQPSPPLGDFTIPFTPTSPLGNQLYAENDAGAGPGISGGMGKPILQLLALFLAGGGLAGVGQNIFGRPPTTTTTPRLSPEQLALLSASQGQFGQSQNILNLLMGGLQHPQIPPALLALTEQAFQPVLGNIGQQFMESIRRRGFAGSGKELLNTGLGGPALGQALSDVQGQMAQAKLNLYQNNIANLIQALQGSGQLGFGQGRLAAGLPAGQVQQVPRPSILDTLSQASGVAKGVIDIGQAAGSASGPGIGSWLSGLNPSSWFS